MSNFGSPVVGDQVFNGKILSQDLSDRSTDPYIVAKDGYMFHRAVATTDSTAAAVTYTAAQLLGGIILRDPNGAGRSDVTPTAALLVAAIGDGCRVGTAFEFTIRNTADAAETITVTAGSGATLSGTMTIAQNNTKRFLVVVTNALLGSEAYTVYSLGTIVH
jgi:hypothetical protein